jgi:translation initiation factor 2A
LATVQWTHDEQCVFHSVTNEIHIYSAKDWKQRLGKIRCQGVTSFSLPSVKGYDPNCCSKLLGGGTDGSNNKMMVKKYLLTAFVAGSNGKPARVDLLRYPDRMGRESSTTTTVATSSGPALTSKSLFNAEEVHVKWSPRADAALLFTQTAVDNTGQSYYGSTHLFLLLESDVKNPTMGSSIVVPLPKEATKDGSGTVPVVSADWIPNPSITGVIPFGVISGRMPALSSLHHGLTGEPTFLFGRAHRNTMDMSPHGRFIVCGGFGNLAGGMDFWDRNKGKLIPRRVFLKGTSTEEETSPNYVTIKEASDLSITSSSPVVGHQWSPDSRTYLVSTTSPRMNVENGVHIYRYDGTLVDQNVLPWDNAKYRPDKLLSAEYVPAPISNCGDNDDEKKKSFHYYPDRPQSPAPRNFTELKGDAAIAALNKLRVDAQSAQTGASSGQEGGGSKAFASNSAYIPPAARKAGGGAAYVPPGARRGGGGGTSLAERMRQEREGSAANVSAVKITKRTGLVGAASVGPVGSGSSGNDNDGGKSKSALRREKQRLAKEKAEKETAEEEERKKKEEMARVAANKNDPEKRAKKIRKALKQIDDIKSKEGKGTELNDDQKAKLATEDYLRKELLSLNLN